MKRNENVKVSRKKLNEIEKATKLKIWEIIMCKEAKDAYGEKTTNLIAYLEEQPEFITTLNEKREKAREHEEFDDIADIDQEEAERMNALVLKIAKLVELKASEVTSYSDDVPWGWENVQVGDKARKLWEGTYIHDYQYEDKFTIDAYVK